MKRMALLSPVGSAPIRESMVRVALVARRLGIEARAFAKSEEVIEFGPDCVLA